MKMQSRLVVKDNALIDASFNLTLIEQRLMLLAIVEARELSTLTPSIPVEVTVKSYIEQYKVKESTAYETLFDACKTLRRREFSYIDRYKNSDAVSTAGWVNKVTYVKSKGIVVLYLSEEVISMISRLEEQFTRYHLEQVSDFNSKYSIRLYEVVIKWLAAGKTGKIAINDLRARLGLQDTEYKTMSLFKTNVLDKAVDEINAKTDVRVKYDQYRSGRTISHFSFTLKEKRVIKTVKDAKQYQFELSAKQVDFFANKLASDPNFGSQYAKVGESVEDFEIRVKGQLAQKTYCAKYSEHLIRLGYIEKT